VSDEQPAQAETKACPMCGETILAVAVKCKHCRSDIGSTSLTAHGSPPDGLLAPEGSGSAQGYGPRVGAGLGDAGPPEPASAASRATMYKAAPWVGLAAGLGVTYGLGGAVAVAVVVVLVLAAVIFSATRKRAPTAASFQSLEQARQELSDATIKKRELALTKRQLTEQMQHRRAQHTSTLRKGATAGTGLVATVLGKEFARGQRQRQSRSNADARESLGRDLQPLERERARLEASINEVDQRILAIQRWIALKSRTGGPSS
jgi:hypothetical protein